MSLASLVAGARANVARMTAFPILRQQWCEYLAPAYHCDEAWTKRLDHPLVKDINPGDYLYDLGQKYKQEGKVSAIDVDLFLNKISKSDMENMVGEVEELVHRLRRSAESVRTLPSTHHALLRTLLTTGATHTILKLLTDPMNFGIFPDHYTCNLLMDAFVDQRNYTAAARVASYLMLQEDFGPPLTQTLALACCYLYVTSEDNLPWKDYIPKPEEPTEEVKIRIRYLRNPYFDDHFDLREPNHIVGKTLAWLSPLVGGMVGGSCELLGWALYNKWSELEAALDRAKSEDWSIAANVLIRVKDIVGGCEDSEALEKVRLAITKLEAVKGKVVEEDLWPAIEKLVTQAVLQAHDSDILAQEEQYRSWEKKREEEFQKQLAEYRKRQLLAEIEQKKKDLAAKEEVIFFFDNKDKLEILASEAKSDTPTKKSKVDDENYIPPEV